MNNKNLPMNTSMKLDAKFNKIISSLLIKEINRAHYYGEQAYNNIFILAVAEYVENELHNYMRNKTNKSYCVQVDIPRGIYINGQEIIGIPVGNFMRIINSLLDNMDMLKQICDDYIAYAQNRKNIIIDLKNQLYNYMIKKDYIVNKDKLKITYNTFNNYKAVYITAQYASYPIFKYSCSLIYGNDPSTIKKDMLYKEKRQEDTTRINVAKYIVATLKMPGYKVISPGEQRFLFDNYKIEDLYFTDKLANRLVDDLRDKYKSIKLLHELSDTN